MTQEKLPSIMTLCDLCLNEEEERFLESFLIKAIYPYSGWLTQRLRICSGCKKVCVQLEHLNLIRLESQHCPKCGSDMSRQAKVGSRQEPCGECYLKNLLEEQK